MEALTSIQILIAKPVSKNTYQFTINGNMDDVHTMGNDRFYLFLNTLVKPPATTQIAKCIQIFSPFLVNVPNNYVKKLDFDSEALEREVYLKSKKINMQEVLHTAMEENNKRKTTDPEQIILEESNSKLEALMSRILGTKEVDTGTGPKKKRIKV